MWLRHPLVQAQGATKAGLATQALLDRMGTCTRDVIPPTHPPTHTHTQALNDRTGELLAVKMVAEDEGVEGGARGEALRLCLATRHPNLVRRPAPPIERD